MSRKESVFIGENGLTEIKKFCAKSDISEASFSRKFKNYNRWVSELRRGRSMPSPQEAARMCALMNVSPKEILTEQADIDLVNGLLEKERAENAKKERPAINETLDRETQNKLFRQIVDNTSDLGTLLEMMDTINKKMQGLK